MYEIAKAAWPPIVDEETFNQVQDMLRDNGSVERRRLDRAQSRIFLLSGLLFCEECGRSLCGQSAHGRKDVHRYYGHSDKRVKTSDCSTTRIRADELEQVVLNHFFHVATSEQYFRDLEKKLKAIVKSSTDTHAHHQKSLQKELKSIEAEINAMFRFQTKGGMGDQGLTLVGERLEQLANKKRDLQNQLLKLSSAEKAEAEIPYQVGELRSLIQDFKRGFSKASPSMKRRLLRKVLKGIVLTSKGLEVSFHIEDSIDGIKNAESNVVPLVRKTEPPRGGNSDLSSLSGELPVLKIGWGTRTRTWECQNQNLMPYQLGDTPIHGLREIECSHSQPLNQAGTSQFEIKPKVEF